MLLSTLTVTGLKVKVMVKLHGHTLKNVHFTTMDALYDMVYFLAVVRIFVPKWSVRPQVTGF